MTKKANCPKCCTGLPTDAKTLHTKDIDENNNPIWVCFNCGNETKRIIRRSKAELIIDRFNDGINGLTQAWDK